MLCVPMAHHLAGARAPVRRAAAQSLAARCLRGGATYQRTVGHHLGAVIKVVDRHC